jgi:hypothetical protein
MSEYTWNDLGKLEAILREHGYANINEAFRLAREVGKKRGEEYLARRRQVELRSPEPESGGEAAAQAVPSQVLRRAVSLRALDSLLPTFFTLRLMWDSEEKELEEESTEDEHSGGGDSEEEGSEEEGSEGRRRGTKTRSTRSRRVST